MERRDASGNQRGHASNLSLSNDFMNETSFQQFIDLIRGETIDPIVRFCPNYDCEHISGCVGDTQFGTMFSPAPHDQLLHFSSDTIIPNSPPPSFVHADAKDWQEENDEDDDDDQSSATTTTTATPTKRTKVDRSRTLISERRRRGRMKEKLYALRSLVPNITKMDKASIVGDAVVYVQELQMQAKKLKAEIAGLESSVVRAEKYQGGLAEKRQFKVTNNNHHPICKNIMQMDMFQVEERVFYVRLVSHKGQGVAVSLYRALESLTDFIVHSTNLATIAERFVLTFTMDARESDVIMNLPDSKLWVTGALMKQGFRFETHPFTS